MSGGFTERLARAAAARPWRTVGLWLAAVAVSIGLIGALLGGALTSEGEMTNNPESSQGYDLLAERLPPEPGEESYGDEIVVVRSERLKVDDPAFQAKLAAVADAIRETARVRRIEAPFLERGERPEPPFASPDGHAVLLPIAMGPNPEEGIERVIQAVERANDAAFDVEITGEWTADRDFIALSEHDLRVGEFFFGIPTAMVILLVVFGAVVAALVPLTLAIVAILVALALTALIGQAFDLSIFVVNMLTGMGLALGIDYSLFVVSRYREERVGGATRSRRSRPPAPRRAARCCSAASRSSWP